MKFRMVLYQIQDYGGIINHAEHLAMGLKLNGHEVDFVQLVPKKQVTIRKQNIKDIEEYRIYGTGYKHHQARGWAGLPKVPYLNDAARKQFKEECATYDAILWHIPVPTLNKDNKNISTWLDLYDHGAKNIAIIHDGNIPKLYPHLLNVSDQFWAAVCVHEAAYNSAECLDIPRTMILNPFHIEPNTENRPFYQRSGFAAVQIFKAWKRMHTLVKAIPHMQNQEQKLIGGAGIEYRYMTSIDKCKPQYYNENGERIWDAALNSGMLYKGVIPNSTVHQLLQDVKLQIDPSWSFKYSGYGAHFNRTTVEAIIQGAVPVATDLGMAGSKVFLKDKNYIEIPHTATEKEFAQIIDNALHDQDQWNRIQRANKALLPRFDQHHVANQYAELVTSLEPCRVGTPSAKVKENCAKNLEFFGISTEQPVLEQGALF